MFTSGDDCAVVRMPVEAVINLLRNKVAAIKWPLPLTEGVEGAGI